MLNHSDIMSTIDMIDHQHLDIRTITMFAAGRAWEQVRNSVCYPHLNVKVVGSHGGLSVGEDGATHQCIEDFALMVQWCIQSQLI